MAHNFKAGDKVRFNGTKEGESLTLWYPRHVSVEIPGEPGYYVVGRVARQIVIARDTVAEIVEPDITGGHFIDAYEVRFPDGGKAENVREGWLERLENV